MLDDAVVGVAVLPSIACSQFLCMILLSNETECASEGEGELVLLD